MSVRHQLADGTLQQETSSWKLRETFSDAPCARSIQISAGSPETETTSSEITTAALQWWNSQLMSETECCHPGYSPLTLSHRVSDRSPQRRRPRCIMARLVERGTAAKRTRAELFSDRLGWAHHRDVDDGKQSQTEGVIALRRTPFGDRGVRKERAQWIPSALKHHQIRGVSFD